MSDPRWTEHVSGALCWKRDEDDDEVGFYLVDGDEHSVSYVYVPSPAIDALVAAVRDAARVPELKATIAGLTTACQKLLDPHNFNGLYANRNAREMLRDLLAPPAPDTGEKT